MNGVLDDLLVEAPTIADGEIALSDRPGLGIRIDEAKLRQYRL